MDRLSNQWDLPLVTLVRSQILSSPLIGGEDLILTLPSASSTTTVAKAVGVGTSSGTKLKNSCAAQ